MLEQYKISIYTKMCYLVFKEEERTLLCSYKSSLLYTENLFENIVLYSTDL